MDTVSFDNASFDAVWRRVTAGNSAGAQPYAMPEPEQNESEMLCRLMDSAALCIACCRFAAYKCPGRIARALCDMALEERRYFKKLRAMYFILTGGAYCPEERCLEALTAAEGLRTIYAESMSAEKRLLMAADTAGESFACTYGGFVAQERRHAETAIRLIEEIIY